MHTISVPLFIHWAIICTIIIIMHLLSKPNYRDNVWNNASKRFHSWSVNNRAHPLMMQHNKTLSSAQFVDAWLHTCVFVLQHMMMSVRERERSLSGHVAQLHQFIPRRREHKPWISWYSLLIYKHIYSKQEVSWGNNISPPSAVPNRKPKILYTHTCTWWNEKDNNYGRRPKCPPWIIANFSYHMPDLLYIAQKTQAGFAMACFDINIENVNSTTCMVTSRIYTIMPV
jgi:hypothetical protein